MLLMLGMAAALRSRSWRRSTHPARCDLAAFSFATASTGSHPARAETLATLATWGCAFGVALIAFLTSIHFLTLEANARTPARLDEGTFFTLLVGFLVVLVAWIVFLALRFGRPR